MRIRIGTACLMLIRILINPDPDPYPDQPLSRISENSTNVLSVVQAY